MAIRCTNLDRMKAVQINKKRLKFHQEIAPTMQEGINKKILSFDDQRRYELISNQVSLRRHEQCNMLDIGCAEGILTLKLCSLSEFVVGLDISRNLVRQGIENAKSLKLKNIDFVIGDAENLPFKHNCFDIITFSEVIEHLLHPELLLAEASDTLSSSGLIILTTPNATPVPMTLNLLIWLEYIFGMRFSRLLSRRQFIISAYWAGENSLILHRDFTFNELSRLAVQSTLKCIEMKSFGFPPTMLLARLLKISYTKWIYMEKLLEKIPILRCMGSIIIVYLEKQVFRRKGRCMNRAQCIGVVSPHTSKQLLDDVVATLMHQSYSMDISFVGIYRGVKNRKNTPVFHMGA